MSILGSVGSLYMGVLILLLIVGLGLIIKGFFEYLTSKNIFNSNVVNKITTNGGAIMQSNGWLRLAVFSFVGILISLAVLALISPNNGMNMNAMNTQATHQSHLGAQSGMTGSMNGGAMVMTPMGNMGMQGNMNGMGMMSMQQPMNNMGNMQMDNNNNMMMNRMNQMQQQMNMMQQQMNMNNMNNMQMQQPMNNMGGMGMMSMPMNNMSGMSGNSGSMGGMSMM